MRRLFGYAMDIGEKMLVCGAEVHRVEETVSRIGYALGAQRVDVFIITSSMVVTIHTPDGETYTQTRRVTASGFDFERLHYLNHLSREICAHQLTSQEIEQRLHAIDTCKRFPLWAEFVSYAVIAGAFTLFFGGGVTEAVVSMLIGVAVRCGLWGADRLVSNKIFGKFLATVIITLLAYLMVSLGGIPTVDKVIIGNIMTLIPGIGLTNAMRDLFTGDSIAGILRTTEAALTALAIAAGYYLVTIIGGLVV